MKKGHLAALLCASAMIVPSIAFSQTSDEAAQQQDGACEILVNYLNEHPDYDFPVTLEEARAFRQDQDEQACRSGIDRINTALQTGQEGDRQQAGASQPDEAQSGDLTGEQQAGAAGEADEDGTIVVEQQPPAITVDQASPEITVHQPQPQVTVRQAQPEILVRQPAPTVTVDIPQPEIIVRMPEPDVDVALAQPEVEVRQPQPQVRVTQPEQPQVEVEEAEADVLLQRQREGAEVEISRSGEPEVRYEREEPQVRINQAEGEPNVRFEQAEQRDQQAAAQSQDQQRQETQMAAREEQAPETTAALPATGEAEGQTIRVSGLLDTAVLSEEGEEIGTVEQVMVNAETGETQILVTLNGTLGEEGKTIALSLEDMTMHGDQLVVLLPDEQLSEAPEWTAQEGFREAGGDQSAQIRRSTE